MIGTSQQGSAASTQGTGQGPRRFTGTRHRPGHVAHGLRSTVASHDVRRQAHARGSADAGHHRGMDRLDKPDRLVVDYIGVAEAFGQRLPTTRIVTEPGEIGGAPVDEASPYSRDRRSLLRAAVRLSLARGIGLWQRPGRGRSDRRSPRALARWEEIETLPGSSSSATSGGIAEFTLLVSSPEAMHYRDDLSLLPGRSGRATTGKGRGSSGF